MFGGVMGRWADVVSNGTSFPFTLSLTAWSVSRCWAACAAMPWQALARVAISSAFSLATLACRSAATAISSGDVPVGWEVMGRLARSMSTRILSVSPYFATAGFGSLSLAVGCHGWTGCPLEGEAGAVGRGDVVVLATGGSAREAPVVAFSGKEGTIKWDNILIIELSADNLELSAICLTWDEFSDNLVIYKLSELKENNNKETYPMTFWVGLHYAV